MILHVCPFFLSAFSSLKWTSSWFWPIHPSLLSGLFCRFFVFFVLLFCFVLTFYEHTYIQQWCWGLTTVQDGRSASNVVWKKTQWNICLICCKSGNIFTPARDFSEGNLSKLTFGFTWPFCLLAHLFFRGAGRILKLLCLCSKDKCQECTLKD